jgi:uncharacterized protein (TIGR02452 family)
MTSMPNIDLPELTHTHLLLNNNNDLAYDIAIETREMVKNGCYINTHGISVNFAKARDAAKQALVVYQPGELIPVGQPRYDQLHITMHNQTTVDVAQIRSAQGYTVAILNFASALTPGGGWLRGAIAQEESLARSSSLVYSLQDVQWYKDKSHFGNPFYDDTVIVTPNLPFFRTHDGKLLDTPWYGSVITSAAVYAHGVRRSMPNRISEIETHMRSRVQSVYRAATTLNANVLILGAWGCGEFGNSPEFIARIMKEELNTVDMRYFEAIDMVVADTHPLKQNYEAFAKQFGK